MSSTGICLSALFGRGPEVKMVPPRNPEFPQTSLACSAAASRWWGSKLAGHTR